MRKKAFITGGLLALILLLGTSTAFAASLDLPPNEIAAIRSEIADGKSIKDVLDEHHITMNQIRSALGTVLDNQGHHKLSNTQIAMIATKLGLDVGQVQTAIDSGKSLRQILSDYSITETELQTVFKTKAFQGKRPKTARFRNR